MGKITNFVSQASGSAERLWSEVETRIPQAIKLCESDMLHAYSGDIGVVRDTVALHYIRNRALLKIHRDSYALARQARRANAHQLPGYAQDFERRFGRPPVSAEDHAFFFEMVLGRQFDEDFQSGLLFRHSVERQFLRSKEWLARHQVQILHPASGSFLVGDAPVITISKDGRMGPSEGVALDGASQVIMPLSPKIVIAFGPQAVGQVPLETVEELNRYQVRAANEFVYVTPGSGLEDFVRLTRFTPTVTRRS